LASSTTFSPQHNQQQSHQETKARTHQHTLQLRLANVSENANNSLMAHFVWQSALLLSKRVSEGIISVQNSRIVEMGAGAGMVGIVGGLCGASQVVETDYPDQGILRTLEENVERCLVKKTDGDREGIEAFWEVVGHKWGDPTISRLLRYVKHSTMIIVQVF
jgi:nicotinamide N-methyltransferase